MTDYYTWETEGVAQAALDSINQSKWFPFYGKISSTGQTAIHAAKTTMWAEALEITLGGLYVFPRVSEELLDGLGVPTEERAAFIEAFKPEIKILSSDDFADQESE